MKFEIPATDPTGAPALNAGGQPGWGSDVAAALLGRLGIPYISLNPGASFRGLHDSLVNGCGNAHPPMLLCLHEDHAVAVAHGWAKVTGRAMAVAVHSNIGLMHASMALYNAWCDRVPLLLISATGPVDAQKRRPGIDWIHTARDQGALVRDFVKWDDQPASVAAMIESFCRAHLLSECPPTAPVHICLDAGLQEAPLDGEVSWPELARLRPPPPPAAPAATVDAALETLGGAKRVVVLCGRGARTAEAFAARVELVERLGAVALSDYKVGSQFPTDHPAHPLAPFSKVGPKAAGLLAEADAVLALDWVDLGGLLAAGAAAGMAADTPVISATVDFHLHGGAHMDHQMLAPVSLRVACDPDQFVGQLLGGLAEARRQPWQRRETKPPVAPATGAAIRLEHVADALRGCLTDPDAITFAALCRGWPVERFAHRGPLAYLGKDGGAGIGTSPGISVGAALALAAHHPERRAVAVLGDGDLAMGITALWTAVHHGLPLLVLVNNNHSYFNDELHQQGIANARGRNPANAGIGQRLDDPALDFAGFARAQGAVGIGPVTERGALAAAIGQGVTVLEAGGVAVVDIHVTPGDDRRSLMTLQTRK